MCDEKSIYGNQIEDMRNDLVGFVMMIDKTRRALGRVKYGDPVDHCKFRIKSDSSMREKCRRYGLPETRHSALCVIRDAIGVRLVCSFINDVYMLRDIIIHLPDCKVVEEKDYIKRAKPNGYRSYHIVVRYRERFYIEIQLRTISMDSWAALEHQLRYKKNLGANAELIADELKRCSDELASTDVSMQTIRDLIYGGEKG